MSRFARPVTTKKTDGHNPFTSLTYVSMAPPQAARKNEFYWQTNPVDTFGYSVCTMVFVWGESDVDLSRLRLIESDSPDSGFLETAAGAFGTSPSIDDTETSYVVSTLPAAGTPGLYVLEIDLRHRKRYLGLLANIDNGVTGAYFSAFALLCDSKNTPTSIEGRGCLEILRR